MRLEPPPWWYRERVTWVARALRPAGFVYGLAGRARWAIARLYRSRLPVICIGNLTAGGAGKTPLAIEVARLLGKRGARPAFLSRGFRGTLRGPHLVDPQRDKAVEVGDEPLLLARHAPTVVARDRTAGARLIETLPVDAIVMDDGLQNPHLAKDLTLAALDPARMIGNGLVMPAGPLRLPLPFQLARTDALVMVSGSGEQEASFPEPLRALTLLRAKIMPAGETACLAGERVVAFAGIGRPGKLFDTLRSLGAVVPDAISFEDHHRYGEADALRLLERARMLGGRLVTTEKDWVRIGEGESLARLKAVAWGLPVEARFTGDGIGDLLERVMRVRARSEVVA